MRTAERSVLLIYSSRLFTVYLTSGVGIPAPRGTMTENASMPSASKLQPAGEKHPCPKMRLGGRQNNLPGEFCLASTCVAVHAD